MSPRSIEEIRRCLSVGGQTSDTCLGGDALVPQGMLDFSDHKDLDGLVLLEQAVHPVLSGIEQAGLLVDTAALMDANRKARHRSSLAEIAFRDQRQRFGCPSINVGSDLQCKKLLGRLGIEVRDLKRRTLKRRGHPLTVALADFRHAVRRKSMVKRLIQFSSRGALFGHIKQFGTATGRISISAFELMNIPRDLRHLIISRQGTCFVYCDFSAMDMMSLASLSDDKKMIDMLTGETDFYLSVAEQLRVDEEEGLERSEIKLGALAIGYGMTPYGLAEVLEWEIQDAGELIGEIKHLFPQAETFLKAQADKAVETWMISSPLGRRRFFDEKERKDKVRRVARNHVIQGHAADVFKERLVALADLLAREKWGRIILPIHDAFLIEVRENCVGEAISGIREVLTRSPLLNISLKMKIGTGATWAEAVKNAE